ncbi:glycosyltransferase family 24 protein [Amanita muscaria]
MMRSAFIALLYATAAINDVRAITAGRPPAVNVSLRTSWPAPPFLVELLESFSLEFPSSFFPLLHLLSDPNIAQKLKSSNPKEIRDETVKLALEHGILEDSTDVAALDSTLALHAATPAVQAFYSFYEEKYGDRGRLCAQKDGGGQAWVDWYGEVACTAAELRELVDERPADVNYTRPQLLTFDHVHPVPSRSLTRSPRTAILYTSLDGHPSNLGELHNALYALSKSDKEDNSVEYVVRYTPPLQGGKESGNGEGEAKGSYLTGYGVALDLKKTDYMVLDDRHSRSLEDNEGKKDIQEEKVKVDPLLDFIQSFEAKEKNNNEDKDHADMNTPLTEAEIVELGYQASQLIISISSLSSTNNLTVPLSSSHSSLSPLSALTLLSQNFPKYTQSLSRRILLSSSVESELRQNALRAQAGANVVWLNGGIIFSPGGDVAGGGGLINGVDVLTMKRVMRREKAWVRTLESLGLTRQEAVQVISDSGAIIGEDGKPKNHGGGSVSSESSVLDGRVDASDRTEGKDVILWWNDLEKDERYARWGASFYGLMRPMFPGQFPTVKRNLFNIILILDLSNPTALELVGGTISNIIERGIPFRFGLVPSLASEENRKMAKAIYWLFENAGRKRTMHWIQLLAGIEGRGFMNMGSSVPENQIDWTRAKEEFNKLVDEIKEKEGKDETVDDLEIVTFDSVVNSQDGDGSLKEVDAYIDRLDVKTIKAGLLGHAFFNGKYLEVGKDVQELLGGLQQDIGYQMQYFQELIYQGTLTDENNPDMANWFYDQPGVSKRRNTYIIPSVGFGPSESGGGRPLRLVSLPQVFEKTGFQWEKVKGGFVYPPGKGALPFSTFVVADLDSEEGLELVKEALKSLDQEAKMRVLFVHNPSSDVKKRVDRVSPRSEILAKLVMTGRMLESTVTSQALAIVLGIDIEYEVQELSTDETQVPLGESAVDLLAVDKIDEKTYGEYTKASRLLARELGFGPGESGVVINGRVIGPMERGSFNAADFKALAEFEYKKRMEAVLDSIENACHRLVDLDRVAYADLVSLTASVLGVMQMPDPSDVGMHDATPKPRRRNYLALERNLTMFTHGDSSAAMYHVVFVLNPLSETAQKWSSMIKWLTEMPEVYIEVHLNPNKQAEIPLKRFYRYNLQSALVFDESGNEVTAQTSFEELPVEPLYTLAMDVPSSWLVRPREALYDLDNIQLTSLSPSDSSVDAVFELDYLVIEGHARDPATNAPPRGLQLQLVDSHNKTIADTLVVANLGYLQFRAKPGVFKLEIREGRAREVYHMESAGNEGWDSPTVDVGGTDITLTSFDGLTLYPRFSRKEGMESASVLEGDETEQMSSGIIGTVTSRFRSFFNAGKGPKSATGVVERRDLAEINIFTVASGLLYERFVGIMILSVLRNTNSTVKFWFIENFLSPSFLEFIPHMAKEYGFQYELVTYKWPSWLRSQREKQRIIWAYKILFLDVLFPMDLKKVIFVDADQIVRADLKELVDLDIHGAPYAYTPMGDDNYDMEGFRFWKKGYWAETLGGKPYHISALYIVDLVRFRQLAAGDILRGQYQQLSADPNSLANLDQDLPNNLQRMVPIHSLHEDWLWCETWCSKDRLHRAKTIDLCQNPLTKEPKLARARQIPEWEEYDAEIARFTRKLAEEGKIRSGMAAADVNALASAGNTPAVPPTTGSAESELGTATTSIHEEL